ncbi:MAG TPA: nitrilase-related carbon-nitrogen hydrolase [Planctomycetota bacterium]|jgi:predicted amidohydrolase|nr:nitrilase-related carbon-nitrogen hydrolase [Planctomycetota bacterium]
MDFLVALAQTRPVLGALGENLDRHLEVAERAIRARARLVVFPELSLTGYHLRDLVPDVALRADDRRLARLARLSRRASIAVGAVEESDDHRFFNSAFLFEGGSLLAVHRKVYLPDYGMFEEGRHFAAGDRFEPVQSRLGRLGLLICEDLWHLSSSYLHFLRRADSLLCLAASPGRGVTGTEGEVGTARAWNTLLEAQALAFTVHVVFCNRVGFEDGAYFWGGSKVVSPFGRVVAQAADGEELVLGPIDGGALRRSRMLTPLRRDEKALLTLREIERTIRVERETPP